MSSARTIVCVLGMHRSGTSCLAGSLEEAGIHLGDVVTEAEHNRKGNREHVGIRQLNDDVLAYSGGAWNDPPPVVRWDSALAETRDRLVDSFFQHTPRWGFKDPRSLLTLPFWEAANVPLRYIGSFRHPSAVVASLARRGDVSPTPHDVLWEIYNRRLLEAFDRKPFPLLCFDDPEPRYRTELVGALRHIGCDASEGQPLRFFDEGLRHHAAGGGVAPTVPLYDALCRARDSRAWEPR